MSAVRKEEDGGENTQQTPSLTKWASNGSLPKTYCWLGQHHFIEVAYASYWNDVQTRRGRLGMPPRSMPSGELRWQSNALKYIHRTWPSLQLPEFKRRQVQPIVKPPRLASTKWPVFQDKENKLTNSDMINYIHVSIDPIYFAPMLHEGFCNKLNLSQTKSQKLNEMRTTVRPALHTAKTLQKMKRISRVIASIISCIQATAYQEASNLHRLSGTQVVSLPLQHTDQLCFKDHAAGLLKLLNSSQIGRTLLSIRTAEH